MKLKRTKYTFLLLLLKDLLIINLSVIFLFEKIHQTYIFNLYLSIYWMISSFIIGYYRVYRHTNTLKIFSLVLTQLLVFILGFFTYFGIFKEGLIVNTQFKTLASIIIILIFSKIAFYFIFRKYKSIVFVEIDETTQEIMNLFVKKTSLGYKVYGYFSNEFKGENGYLGKLDNLFEYVLNSKIDQVYLTLSKLNKVEIRKITKFASHNDIDLKLIPNSNELYSKSRQEEFYDGNFKILTVKKLPFEYAENRLVKRLFDIVFSLLVILLLMSWLTPILWILIRLESRGNVFFKQEREGLNGEKFMCYKFRSMKKNDLADKIHATKNDSRVTKMGKFIRKTSIDELPQFFNVFLGNMSVVGPRPHMENLAIEYQKDVDNYMERHAMKPGITGLAQVSGYRGEVIKPSDIRNRIRLDIFYIENWSFLLDIKIIVKTIVNVFKGEEKAY